MGEVIPEELVTRMRNAHMFGRALGVRQQVFYAQLSLQLHNQDPTKMDTDKMVEDLQSKFAPFDHVKDTHFQASFGHLMGYSAVYYTYMWSEAYAHHIMSVFKTNGLLDKETAIRYRDQVLRPGGEQDADDLVHAFTGKPFDLDAFHNYLSERPTEVGAHK